MLSQFFENFLGGRRGAFLVFFGLVTAVLLGGSYWVITFVRNATVEADEAMMADENAGELSLIYVDFYTDVSEYVEPESYLTMAQYVQENEETQNVEVLTGLSPNEITGYMLNHFVAGMRVDCSYCHNVQNYAADEWDDEEAMERKNIAREHLLMTQDLNQNWLTQLSDLTDQKQPSGAQITCATCHNGVAQPVTYPGGIVNLPDSFRLPLDEAEFSVEEEGLLNVNARDDIGLETVQYQQQVMYYMNASMNVGCTHCHNSRYFPSWEVPAKYYSNHMLQMTQYLHLNYSETLGGQQPSCLMCHNGAVIPGGSARSVDVIAPPLAPPQPDEAANNN